MYDACVLWVYVKLSPYGSMYSLMLISEVDESSVSAKVSKFLTSVRCWASTLGHYGKHVARVQPPLAVTKWIREDCFASIRMYTYIGSYSELSRVAATVLMVC